MRFLHLADLHFGKSLHGRSLLAEDQTREFDSNTTEKMRKSLV